MSRQYFIPGVGYINETGTRQYLVTGSSYINETVAGGSTYNDSLTFGCGMALADGVSASAVLAMALGVGAGLSPAVAASVISSLALGAGVGVVDSGAASVSGAMTLGVGAGIVEGGSALVTEALAAGAAVGLVSSGAISVSVLTQLGVGIGEVSGVSASIADGTLLGVSASVLQAAMVTAVGSLPLGLQLSLQAISGQLLREVITLSQNLGVDASAVAGVNAGVTLTELLALSPGATLQALATIGFGLVANLDSGTRTVCNSTVDLGVFSQFIAASLSGDLRIRLFLVPIILRLLSVSVHSRSFVVPEDSRTMLASEKDPLAIEIFTFDWSGQISTEAISNSSWSADDAALTLASSTHTGTTTSVKVSGGVLGTTYNLKNTVTLSPSGQVLVRNMRLKTILE